MKLFEKSVHHNDAKAIIVLQEGPQEVRFRPCPSFVNPFFRVLERVENIMQMNIYSLLKTRKNLEEESINVAIHFTYVRRVNEENIVCLKRVKHPEVKILNASGDDNVVFLVLFMD
jgi:hypothetical protein